MKRKLAQLLIPLFLLIGCASGTQSISDASKEPTPASSETTTDPTSSDSKKDTSDNPSSESSAAPSSEEKPSSEPAPSSEEEKLDPSVIEDDIRVINNLIGSKDSKYYTEDDFASLSTIGEEFAVAVALCETEDEVTALINTYRARIEAVPTYDYPTLKTSILSSLEALEEGETNADILAVIAQAKTDLANAKNDKDLIEGILTNANAAIQEIKDNLPPETLTLNVSSINAYGDWFITTRTNDFTNDKFKSLSEISVSNNPSASMYEHFVYGAGTAITLVVSGRADSNKTTGTEYSVHFVVELTDGTKYTCDYDVINGAIATLTSRIAAAKTEVNGYYASKGYEERLYDEDSWQQLLTLRANCLTDLDGAQNKEQIASIVAAFKAAADAVEQRPLDLSDFIYDAKNELQAYVDSQNRIKYLYGDNWDELEGYLSAAETDFEACTSEDEVTSTKNAYLGLMKDVEYAVEVRILEVQSIYCYNEWHMQVTVKNLSITDINYVRTAYLSNNTGASCGEQIQSGANAIIRLDANGRAAENKTTGTEFDAMFVLAMKDGTFAMAPLFHVKNGVIVK